MTEMLSGVELTTLERLRDQKQQVVLEAKRSLQEAKAIKTDNGKLADPIWFAKTKDVIRTHTVEVHDISRKIKDIKNRQLSGFLVKFHEIAKRKLNSKIYSDLVKSVN